jgi:uncharacterized protein (TIGR01777 family)
MSGSSGFIGKPLFSFLQSKGHKVVPLVRTKEVPHTISWDPTTGSIDEKALEGFDAFIHLAGENITSGRWTKKKKEKLFQSRCRDTWLLSQALSRLANPPKTVIAASAIGFYGDRGDELLTEESHKGEGFLPDLCKKWEEATASLEAKGVRVIQARFGGVLSPHGGMFAKLLPLYKLGLGSKLGSGKQFISWIALEDLIGALYHALFTPEITAALNVVSPYPVRQEEFAKLFAKKLHRPAFIHIPAFLLRLALGEMADALLLASTRTIPKRLIACGYQFHYPHLNDFLMNC